MGTIISGLFSWLFGGGLSSLTGIASKIVDLQAKKIDAKTEQEKNELDSEIARLQVQQAVVMNENDQQRKWTTAGRALFVFPVGLVVWKLMAWDNVICRFLENPNRQECITEKLSPDIWWIIVTVIGFLFLQSITNVLKR